MSFPKEDIRPLDLFSKNGGALEKIGNINHVFVAGMAELPCPQVKEDLHTANISKMTSDSVHTKLGLGLLSNILAGMGVKDLEVSTQFGFANHLTFQFNDVFEDKIELLELDAFLSAAKILPIGNNTKKLIEKNELYVITSVLKSNSISIHLGNTKKVDNELQIAEIHDILKGSVGVSYANESKSDITFEGQKKLVFGFRAVRLFFEGGGYTAYNIASDVVGRSTDGNEEDERMQYEMENAFIDL